MMFFTAIVTAHGAQDVYPILKNLMDQTRPPDQVVLIHSELHSRMNVPENLPYSLIIFPRQPNLNDWGHAKRALGLRYARGRGYVGFFNADDSYDLTYLEKMLAASASEAGFVYCYWSGSTPCRPCLGSSTSGNFIVDVAVGTAVGYLSRAYEADGHFIDAVVEYCDGARRVDGQSRAVVCVPENLYTHNVVYTPA